LQSEPGGIGRPRQNYVCSGRNYCQLRQWQRKTEHGAIVKTATLSRRPVQCVADKISGRTKPSAPPALNVTNRRSCPRMRHVKARPKWTGPPGVEREAGRVRLRPALQEDSSVHTVPSPFPPNATNATFQIELAGWLLCLCNVCFASFGVGAFPAL